MQPSTVRSLSTSRTRTIPRQPKTVVVMVSDSSRCSVVSTSPTLNVTNGSMVPLTMVPIIRASSSI